jgi:hypothetical protein
MDFNMWNASIQTTEKYRETAHKISSKIDAIHVLVWRNYEIKSLTEGTRAHVSDLI